VANATPQENNNETRINSSRQEIILVTAQIIQIMGSTMTTSTLREFAVHTCSMWFAMAITALWYGLMLVGVTFHTADSFMLGFSRQQQTVGIIVT